MELTISNYSYLLMSDKDLKQIFMKQLITFIFLFSVFGLQSQENYSRARIMLEGKNLSELAKRGIDLSEGNYKHGYFFETDFTQAEIEKLREAGYKVDVSITDVKKFYRERAEKYKNLKVVRNMADEWVIPQNWEYGTMAGYYTLDEIMAELDSMAVKYPELISQRQPISTDTLTHEGRMQYWAKISDNPNTDEDEPELLYTSVHHAREVISVQQQIFFMWYLLENYETDESIKYIIDNTELYFVPVINPDGYQYNVTNDPSGGGMWRKNLRDNGDGTLGVDLNRNYGYFWGLDDEGSSPYTGDATYRGPEAFSEPEIKNMRDFCNSHEFRITLNYHSYGNLLLEPWGYTDELPDDHTVMHIYAEIMTQENNYSYGPGYTSIYPTNGGSDDWMYGEQSTKEAIFSYTPEIGNSGDGFWPEVPRIIPLCQEQMWQNLSAARFVGNYAVVKDLSPTVNSQFDNYAKFEIQRLGMTEADSYTVSIEALDENIVETGDPVVFEGLGILEKALDSVSYFLDAGIEDGTTYSYLLSIENGDYTLSDTITKIYGNEVVIFSDNGDNMENWTSNYWDITPEHSFSPPYSITDSPGGEYSNSKTNIIEMDTAIDLTNVEMAFLKFWAKWDIEEGYDYNQILVSTNNGSSWNALEGKYTKSGSQYQDPGKPIYDGTKDWVQEEIDLSAFAGEIIKFRFKMRSDTYVTGDGFYFDDFTVSVISQITSVKNNSEQSIFVSGAFPNPANDQIKVQYALEQNNLATLELYNAVGSKLKTIQVTDKNGVLTIKLGQLKSGVYYYRLVNGKQVSKTSKFIKY